MYISYERLWKLLLERGMKKTDLLTLCKISSRTLSKLSKDANVNTWNYKITGELQHDSKKQLSVISQMEYNFYEGYTPGVAQPSFLWNMELHKSIKSVTLSLYLRDILNQTSSFSRTTSANYVEDSYRNIIGQRILFGITINFGKMNSSRNRIAQSAMFRMMM